MKKLQLKINIDIFKFGIIVFFSEQLPEGHERAIALTKVSDDFNPAIYFNISKPIPIPTIAHEVIHALKAEFDKRGIELCNGVDDELLPYSVGYCMEKILLYCEKNDIKMCYSEKD
jgi:hypothetical protein